MKNNKFIYSVFLVIILATPSFSQNHIFNWAKQMGGIYIDRGRSIATDANGNVFTTGDFQGIVDFDPGTGIENLTSQGYNDIFVQKLDNQGNLMWVKQIGGSGIDLGFSIATDNLGNVYTLGIFHNTVDFDPGTGVLNLTSNGNTDVFIQKLDNNGNLLWVKQLGGTGGEQAYSINIDIYGSILTTGSFQNTVDFDPGTGVSNIIADGYTNVFIQKLDANGNFLWAKNIGGTTTSISEGFSISTDTLGNVFTTGRFNNTVDFDPSINTFFLSSLGDYDIFIQKLNSNGDFMWAKQIGSLGSNCGNSIEVDNIGNIYTTGSFQNTADFNTGSGYNNITSSGSYDIFIHKLDNNGNYLWAKSFGSNMEDRGFSLTTDDLGNTYSTGIFHSTIDFDPGPGVSNLISNGANDCFILKLNSNGNLEYVKQIGGNGDDFGFSIISNQNNEILTTGYFGGSVDFDPGAGVYNLSSGNLDIFIQKLQACSLLYLTENITACDSFMWLDSITYFANNNSATHTIINPDGCDTIITLNLIVNSVSDISTSTQGATITANNPNGIYQWIDCSTNSDIIGENSSQYTATVNGNYAVEITENNCIDTSDCVTISNVGIIENNIGVAYRVFPNPTDGQFNIIFETNIESVEISIMNILGKTIESTKHQNTNNISLEIKQTAGIYFIEIKTPNGKQIIKVTKK